VLQAPNVEYLKNANESSSLDRHGWKHRYGRNQNGEQWKRDRTVRADKVNGCVVKWARLDNTSDEMRAHELFEEFERFRGRGIGDPPLPGRFSSRRIPIAYR